MSSIDSQVKSEIYKWHGYFFLVWKVQVNFKMAFREAIQNGTY